MASHPHEETLNIFARRPEFLRRVLELPPDAKIERDDPVVKPPQDHIADAVRVVVSEEGRSKRAIIIEAQINRDDGKGAVWNHYSSGVRLQLGRCRTLLLVVTLTKRLRRWAKKEIDLEIKDGHSFPYLILGPEIFPAQVEPEDALKDPELTVLSAMGHICRARSTDDPLPVMLTLARLMSKTNYTATCKRLLRTGFSGEELKDLEDHVIANPAPDYNAFREYFKLYRDDEFDAAVEASEERGVKIGEKRGVKIGEKRGVKIGEKRGVKIGMKIGRTIGAIAQAVASRGWVLSEAQEAALMKQDLELLKRRLAYAPQAESVEALLADDL